MSGYTPRKYDTSRRYDSSTRSTYDSSTRSIYDSSTRSPYDTGSSYKSYESSSGKRYDTGRTYDSYTSPSSRYSSTRSYASPATSSYTSPATSSYSSSVSKPYASSYSSSSRNGEITPRASRSNSREGYSASDSRYSRNDYSHASTPSSNGSSKLETLLDNKDDVGRTRRERRSSTDSKPDSDVKSEEESKSDGSNTSSKYAALAEWRRQRALQRAASAESGSEVARESVKSDDTGESRLERYRRRRQLSEERKATPVKDDLPRTSESLSVGIESASTRSERIAKYKEERRKELSAMSGVSSCLDADNESPVKPSLFLTASSQRQSSEERAQNDRDTRSTSSSGRRRRQLPEIPVSVPSPESSDSSKGKGPHVSSDSGISENEARFRKSTDDDVNVGSVRRSVSLRNEPVKSRSRENTNVVKSRIIDVSVDGNKLSEEKSTGLDQGIGKSLHRSNSDAVRSVLRENTNSELESRSGTRDKLKLKHIAKRCGLKRFEVKSGDSAKERSRKNEKRFDGLTSVNRAARSDVSPDALDELLEKNAAFLTDVDLDADFHSTFGLSKEGEVTGEKPPADDVTCAAVSIKQTAHYGSSVAEDANNVQVNVTLQLDSLESSGDFEDTEMKKSFGDRFRVSQSDSPGSGRLPFRSKENVQDSDSFHGSTESDVFDTAPSTPSSTEPVRRKVRKDKSALRKSSLNKPDEDNDSSPFKKIDTSSNLPGGETKVSHYGMAPGRQGIDSTHNPSVPPASNIQSRARTVVQRVAQNNKANLMTGPTKITINRYGREEVKKRNIDKKNASTSPSLRELSRSKDISSLIQRFSSSDASGSEKSDSESNVVRRHVIPVRRQDHVTMSSSPSDESNTETSSRRTLERTQSLRVHAAKNEKNESNVQRAGSFKSNFMRARRCSPDKPVSELTASFNRSNTSLIVTGTDVDKDGRVELGERWDAAEVDEVIADSEVAAVLKARRKRTDSIGTANTTDPTPVAKSYPTNNISDSTFNMKDLESSLALLNRVTDDLDSPCVSSDSEALAAIPIISGRKRSSQESIAEAQLLIKDVETSISTHLAAGPRDRLQPQNNTTSAFKEGSDNASDNNEITVTYNLLEPSIVPDSAEAEVVIPLDNRWVTDRRKKEKLNTFSPLPSKFHNESVVSKPQDDANVPSNNECDITHCEISIKLDIDRSSLRSSSNESNISVSSTLRRSESLKDQPLSRTESFERRKGILKRSPSLPKQPTCPIVDKELAERLRRQREKENDLSDEDLQPAVVLSAIDDIQEAARREMQEIDEGETNDSTSKMSVLERISRMENILEEEKVSTSRPRSGFATPKSQRSWLDKSNSNSSIEDPANFRYVSGEQLIEKLSVLVVDIVDPDSKPVSVRRQQLQKRARDDWRTRTQPVTVEEIHAADQLSLSEKVKLFTMRREEKLPSREETAVPRRQRRKNVSRYNTQPVTIEEVEKASSLTKVSPLAASLIKPPDPEILQCLPISAQRELMAQHAEKILSQPNSRPSSRPSSRPGSRRGSSHDLEDETIANLQGVKSILKQQSPRLSPESDMRGILKAETEKRDVVEPRSILKNIEGGEVPIPKQPSILKNTEYDKSLSKTNEDSRARRSSPETSASAADTSKGILKTTESKPDLKPKGILKGEGSDGSESRDESRSCLKEAKAAAEPRGILKKEGSFETRNVDTEKGVLKHTDSHDVQNMRSILKRDVVSEDVAEYNLYESDGSDKDTTPTLEPQPSVQPQPQPPVQPATQLEETPTRSRRRQGERYLTQPADYTPEKKSPQSRRKYKYGERHMTQPITPEEMKEAEASSTPSPGKLGGSIGDRLNALKKSGDEDWRRRVPKTLDFDQTPVKLRDKTNLANVERPTSIADRLNQLEETKGGWKERIEEKDQEKFTVKGRIGRGGAKESPLVSKLRSQTPKSGNSPVTSPVHSPTSPLREFAAASKKISLPKEIISGPPPEKTEKEKREQEVELLEKKEPVRVSVPQISEDIESFFGSRDITTITDKIEVDIDDFNEIFMRANNPLPTVKRARPARTKSLRGRNHLKTRSQHLELKDEYDEVNRGVAEKEFKRMKKESMAKDAGFAQEALAGLASKENFSKVSLRKAETSSPTKSFQPFKELMLLHVKGRYKVQTRLVEPNVSSINSGDCYILIMKDKIINWVGEYCNVIEKAKSADIAGFIQQKKDMGCKNCSMTVVDESLGHLGAGKHFWAALGGQADYQGCGPDEEDELYESHIIKTNMVYRLQDNSLAPYEEYWGMQSKYEMLHKDELYVFDFGSELYLWQGKTVSMERRKMGLKLAQKLWDKGYDYDECSINPLCPLQDESNSTVSSKSKERPPWALFGKVNQNMETILFKEKFADWPDSSRLIGVKSNNGPVNQKMEVSELQPYDAKLMLPVNNSPVTLLLEGSNVGRGTKWFEDMEGFIREVDILTLGVSVWHVMEYDHYKMPAESYGQFHDGDTYVVRWQYMIANAGMRTLKGHAARHSLTGRERCCYFFWQGKGSTINEQGASALMTVELDEERGPQIRVIQGKERPCFLNLFEGRMMVHAGKREDASTNTQGSWRFYCVRGEYASELCLVEIPLCTDNLRSRSSFVLLSVKTGFVYIWHGAKSPTHTRELALNAVEMLKEKCPVEVCVDERACLSVTEMDEGSERRDFWGPLGGRPCHSYISRISESRCYDYTPRLFYMCSVSGVFKVTEVQYEARSNDLVSPFPFLQADLYTGHAQPALLLLDNDHEVYMWQGWWPAGDEEQENVATGSARARFDVDRRCAMQTALQYCAEKNPSNPPSAHLVNAGVEPQCFTNLFPYWQVDESVKEIVQSEGKEDDYKVLLSEVLARLTRTQFSLDELLERPLPEGVDPSKLEWYLDEDTFKEMFDMTKDEFYKLPNWRQRQIKQPTGLF